jgi:hypothetical protein
VFGNRITEKGGGGVQLWRKMGEKGKKSDLKAGHVRPKNKYVQTYIGTFNRTRAGAWVSSESCVRTYVSKFKRMRAGKCVCDGALRSNTRR